MVLEYNTDVGSCVSTIGGSLSRIDCAGDDGKNYCCTNPIGLHLNITSRICCTYQEYADQHWAILSAIKFGSIWLTTVFAGTVTVLFFLLISSLGISEEDIQASRRVILKELMKKQILYKSKRGITPSAVAGFKRLSETLSSSLTSRAGKKDGGKQTGTDERRRRSADNTSKLPSNNNKQPIS